RRTPPRSARPPRRGRTRPFGRRGRARPGCPRAAPRIAPSDRSTAPPWQPALPDLVDEDRIADHGDRLAPGEPGVRVTRPAEPRRRPGLSPAQEPRGHRDPSLLLDAGLELRVAPPEVVGVAAAVDPPLARGHGVTQPDAQAVRHLDARDVVLGDPGGQPLRVLAPFAVGVHQVPGAPAPPAPPFVEV